MQKVSFLCIVFSIDILMDAGLIIVRFSPSFVPKTNLAKAIRTNYLMSCTFEMHLWDATLEWEEWELPRNDDPMFFGCISRLPQYLIACLFYNFLRE